MGDGRRCGGGGVFPVVVGRWRCCRVP